MKKKLTTNEMIMISSMLFGMFFGAGNLIFPIHMGQIAGSNVLPAFIGFIITGVGLPLLAVVAFGKSRSRTLYDMAARVGKKYGLFFTLALYLTVGPLFAIPRCATTSFTIGLQPIIGENRLGLLVFSALFFLIVVSFSLRPGKIMDWIGKYLNPLFLLFFGALLIIAFINPMGSVQEIIPTADYQSGPLFNGILEGYNTMDALAGLAFGIVVVNVIRERGVEDPGDIATATAKAGFFSCILMAVIYGGACMVGAQSAGTLEVSENGGVALAQICSHYLGSLGSLFMAVIVTLACVKTSIGLVTSIAEAFSGILTHGKGYRAWAIGFSVFAFLISNIGLDAIITYSLPMLMFLYPLSLTLSLLAIFGNAFGQDRRVYISVTTLTAIAAFFDGMNTLGVTVFNDFANAALPFYSLGLGWIMPALLGLVIGLILHKRKRPSHSFF